MLAKIAFLFLTISDVYHESTWINFFARDEDRNKDRYTIYVHPKHTLSPESFFRPFEITHTVPTSWANTMRAQIELLREALKNKENEKFIFVSESTIPLQSFDEVYAKVMGTSKSIFNFSRNNLARSFGPLKGDMLYKNAQWVILNRKHAQMMADDTKFIDLMTEDPHDQEHYPSTFLAQFDLLHEVQKQDLTLAIWTGENGNAHPHSFTNLKHDAHREKLISAIERKRFLFARKFEKKCNLSLLKPYLPWVGD